eukprot:TRINITY_DN1767_c0_g2_i1.p1 TRINITY_DN1767_c0_g2~~TRINITY_DN1767_c0_g2_i1.p1  ORF type:complete len:704 (+),score=172.37 TRINITY_DN1767_c0_g2_i1:218-2113(+)
MADHNRHTELSVTGHSSEELNNMNRLLDFSNDGDEEDTPVRQEMPNIDSSAKTISTNNVRAPDDREDTCVYVEQPQANLMCPIHRGLFTLPVIAKCGHTFCRTCITRWIESGSQQINECPLDKTVFKADDIPHLINNIVVADSIQGLKVYCKYGCKKEGGRWIKDEGGCSQIVRLAKRKEHEEQCPYATIKCPYSDSCPPIRRMLLDEHLKTCARISCPHKRAGCTFSGTKPKVDAHLATCAFEQIKGFVVPTQEQLGRLKYLVESKEDESKALHSTIAQLNSRLDFLSDSFSTKVGRLESTIRQLTTSLEGTQNQLAEAEKEIEALRRRKRNAAEENPIELNIEQHFEMLNCKGTFTGHSGPVWGLAISSDGFVVSASSDTTIKIWDVANFKCKQTLTGHEGIVHAVVVWGNKLCSGSSDKTIRIWDLTTMQCVKVIKTHDNTVCSLATANGKLFSGSFAEIKVWSLDTYECIQTLTGHNHWVRALTASSDGFLYSGSYNIIKIWDTKSLPFQCIRSITGNYGSIYSLAISKEHRRLLSGTYENKINVYDLETYQVRDSLSGHIGAVYTLAVSGNRFFSGSYDSTIKAWSLDSLKCLQTMVRHSSSVDALVGAGGYIFSGSADHSVKVWK